VNRDERLAELHAAANALRVDPDANGDELQALIEQINAIRAEEEREARAGVVRAILAEAQAPAVVEPEPEPAKRGPGRPRKVPA
jgi:hypothetical protein